ncbi:hypothetical protein HZH66_001616 [Vespula vulgaris]|uniref:RNA-binding protein MEX3B n=1 Tax=Vespula vulgaris TaxID=7454 RepID=A0A834KUX9_VESVU|nr:hypothetical protein HZH66_001616 [Vespula vulgaris]
MPTSLFSEMDRCTNGGGAGSIEEQRALQLAFELSMLGLEGTPGCPGSGTTTVPGTNADPDPLQTAPSSVFEEARSKKSQNMTECVPVPSSEHVAEIVGRQGSFLDKGLSDPCPYRFDPDPKSIPAFHEDLPTYFLVLLFVGTTRAVTSKDNGISCT